LVNNIYALHVRTPTYTCIPTNKRTQQTNTHSHAGAYLRAHTHTHTRHTSSYNHPCRGSMPPTSLVMPPPPYSHHQHPQQQYHQLQHPQHLRGIVGTNNNHSSSLVHPPLQGSQHDLPMGGHVHHHHPHPHIEDQYNQLHNPHQHDVLNTPMLQSLRCLGGRYAGWERLCSGGTAHTRKHTLHARSEVLLWCHSGPISSIDAGRQ